MFILTMTTIHYQACICYVLFACEWNVTETDSSVHDVTGKYTSSYPCLLLHISVVKTQELTSISVEDPLVEEYSAVCACVG